MSLAELHGDGLSAESAAPANSRQISRFAQERQDLHPRRISGRSRERFGRRCQPVAQALVDLWVVEQCEVVGAPT